MVNTDIMNISDASGAVLTECTKARVLLSEVSDFFDDTAYPPSAETLEAISANYPRIAVKLMLLLDVLNAAEKATREIAQTSADMIVLHAGADDDE